MSVVKTGEAILQYGIREWLDTGEFSGAVCKRRLSSETRGEAAAHLEYTPGLQMSQHAVEDECVCPTEEPVVEVELGGVLGRCGRDGLIFIAELRKDLAYEMQLLLIVHVDAHQP